VTFIWHIRDVLSSIVLNQDGDEEPQVGWTSMLRLDRAQAIIRYWLIDRGIQAFRYFVLRAYGEAVVCVAKAPASRLQLTRRLIGAVAYIGRPAGISSWQASADF
jgi:hypothetical protein